MNDQTELIGKVSRLGNELVCQAPYRQTNEKWQISVIKITRVLFNTEVKTVFKKKELKGGPGN